ncbi:2OG-Fe(II) oxygenase [Phormidium tenue FACHB-886]|nr:2OG-Fe(II) oxygenase [Phormidium tenue FACHB-886]
MPLLTIGDPAPWFTLPSTSNPNYHFDTVGGYRTVLFFFGSAKHPQSASVLQQFCERQAEFAALEVPFFGTSIDPEDRVLTDVIENPTFFKFLWDFECRVSETYGVCQKKDGAITYRPMTLVLDENLCVLQTLPIDNPETHVDQVIAFLKSLPVLDAEYSMAAWQAPVLLIPRVLDPAFCRQLIQLYEADGGRDSGFMREKDGQTVEMFDYDFKKRRDFNLVNADTALREEVNAIVIRRIKPAIEKAFQFSITRFERYLVACYEAENQGFFNRHRDNTTKGTAHRRFAMTLNLNTGDYEGGCLWFPEYGKRLYRPAVGEAIIFSCSLLHEVTPVTHGRRFALLSFFYNEADAQVRQQNRQFLESAKADLHHPAPKSSRGFQPSKKRR